MTNHKNAISLASTICLVRFLVSPPPVFFLFVCFMSVCVRVLRSPRYPKRTRTSAREGQDGREKGFATGCTATGSSRKSSLPCKSRRYRCRVVFFSCVGGVSAARFLVVCVLGRPLTFSVVVKKCICMMQKTTTAVFFFEGEEVRDLV